MQTFILLCASVTKNNRRKDERWMGCELRFGVKPLHFPKGEVDCGVAALLPFSLHFGWKSKTTADLFTVLDASQGDWKVRRSVKGKGHS